MHMWTKQTVRLGVSLPQVSRQWSSEIFAQRQLGVYGPEGIVEAVSPDANLHTDVEAARRQGLEYAVGAAPQAISQIHQIMLSAFGVGWIAGGSITVKMIKPLRAQDFTTAKGRVISLSLETREGEPQEAVRALCRTWVERRDGTPILVGTASANVCD